MPDTPEPRPAPLGQIDLSAEVGKGPLSWADALKELESATPAPKPQPRPKAEAPAAAPAPPAEPTPAPAPTLRAGEPNSRYDQIRRTPGMQVKTEDVKILDELSTILGYVNSASAALAKFTKDHPTLVAPNISYLWQDNLKETSTVMLREFHALRNGRLAKSYDKRNVCTKCHTVYMSPLPDGICDECRSNTGDHTTGEY
ncbi:MAG: hypothetical protein SF028_06620 [Candidatus Sumerlaeia bacterium]|nr:hypothetical protein [Candidatus Sumerlaeia bacterium]